jgi:cyclic beta-1,2-glucan synthetase
MALSHSYLPLKLDSLLGALARWKTASRRLPQEPALRAELFSADQMELHGVRLAGQHRLSTGAGLDHLLPRLTNSEATLLKCVRTSHEDHAQQLPGHARRRVAA